MKKIIIAVLVLTLTSCSDGAKHRPIVDKQTANYEIDLKICQQNAKKADNDDAALIIAGSTAVGGFSGWLAGANHDLMAGMFLGSTGSSGAAIGLALGAVAGVITAVTVTEIAYLEKQETMVVSCMKKHSHKVVGNKRKILDFE